MKDCRSKFRNHVLIWILSLEMSLVLTGYAPAESAPGPSNIPMLWFDAIIELNAPQCRTHVVQFVRYWVSPESYRVAVVWAEPHASSLNYPIYPPTMNVASDREAFRVKHQFKHTYDGVFPRPLGSRGSFRHKFNSYYFSDIRFAEQDALDMRIHCGDIGSLTKTGVSDSERIFDVNVTGPGNKTGQKPSRLSIRATKDRLDELSLLDAEGKLLKSIEYKYTQQNDGSQLHRQSVLLPKRPITVGFKGKGPTITIAGEKRQYSQLEMMHHEDGRKCIVDYQPIKISERTVTLPCRITVYSGDGNRVLRSAKLYNFTHCQISADQLKEATEQFSHFDDNEMRCREMLLKYWVKDPADVNQVDRKTLEQLRAHFAEKSAIGITAGEQFRHVNVLLQLDWMLGNDHELERDFQQYMSLLTKNDLDRMILVGGQNAIELTIRWGQIDTADKLLDIWLDAAVRENNVESVLYFATNNVRKKRFWTIVKLMDKVLETSQLSASQQFVAKTLRCIGLAQLYTMVKDPDYIKTELGIAEAWWVSSRTSAESLRTSARQGIVEAKRLFDGMDKPTRQHKVLRAQLEKVNPGTQNAKLNDPNDIP